MLIFYLLGTLIIKFVLSYFLAGAAVTERDPHDKNDEIRIDRIVLEFSGDILTRAFFLF